MKAFFELRSDGGGGVRHAALRGGGRRRGFSAPLSDGDLERVLDITEGWERDKIDAIRKASRDSERWRLREELRAIRGARGVTAAVRAARLLRKARP